MARPRIVLHAHGSQAPPADETIHTTANHPWLTADRGWVQAGDLRVGEAVITLGGGTATVTALAVRPGTANYYNLTVSDLHTYAVGTSQFVVHNTDGPGGCEGGDVGLRASGALRQAAVEVHDLATPAIRHNMSTVALAEFRMPDGETQIFASGSSGRLSSAQIARLRELGVPAENILRGPVHAEMNILNGFPEGASQIRWGIAWAGGNKSIPCPACAPFDNGIIEGAP